MAKFRKYKRKIHFSRRQRLLFSALAAIVVFVFVLFALYFSGYKVEKESPQNDDVGFVGKKDGNGIPLNGKIYFSDGTTAYVGDGSVTYSDGSVFFGTLSAEFKREGSGVLSFANGDKYEGEFVSDEINGYGTYEYSNGDRYEGNFKNGIINGYGVYRYANGDVYSGNFSNGLKNGEGTFVLSDGSKFEGTFENGKKIGKGVYVYSNGDRYEGDFKNDIREGYGVYYWANGERYEGDFANNNINGWGTYYWVDGERNTYSGYFKDGIITVVETDKTSQ